jgi:Cdc6-like AAA superfamily ATPase
MMRKAEAISLLNGTKMPSKFRFREKEIERIEGFLEACGKEEKGIRFLMLTGSPGAGKSLCANTVLARRKMRVIKLNANIVKSLQEVQLIVAGELLGEGGKTPHTASHLVRMLEAHPPQECVVYIEEVELLFKADPGPLTEDFMKLFQKKGLRLILIGISNTIDTLLKCSNKFGFKIHEVENVIFSPYTAEHIAEIMKDKIAEVRAFTRLDIAFPDKLLRFAAQKLETLKKGDFRVCLEFLKGVAQLLLERQERKEEGQEGQEGEEGEGKKEEGKEEKEEREGKKGEEEGKKVQKVQKQEEDGEEERESFAVQIGQVNAVLGKMNVSKNLLIENLPYQQKVMLIAIYAFFKKTDALSVSPLELQPEVRWVCDSLQITYSKQLMSDGLSELQQYSLIDLKQRNDGQRIMLKIGLQDIEAVFSDHFIFKKFFTNT